MDLLSVYCEALYPSLSRVPGTDLTLDRSIWSLLHTDLRRTTRVRPLVDFVVKELTKLRPVMQGDAV